MKVVVVPEDATHDPQIIKPVLERLFDELSLRLTLYFCREPCIRGVDDATDETTLLEVFDCHPMADLFLMILDRDCKQGRQDALDRCQEYAKTCGKTMFGCLAIEELEVWALALHRKELDENWQVIRADCNPKEAYFEPFVEQKKWHTGPGKGRKAAMKAIKGNWKGLKALCGELETLQEQLAAWKNSFRPPVV